MQAKSMDAPLIVKLPIYTGADIAKGALIMPGVTADQDISFFILGATAAADAVGTLCDKYVYATLGSSAIAGTSYVLREVEISDQYRFIEAEYDTTDTLAVASTSGTTVTITSLTQDIDGSWLYAVSGTGAGTLAYCVSTASGSAVTKTATGWDSTTTCIKIMRLGHQLVKLNSAGTKIGTDAADGSWTVVVLENWIERNGTKVLLDPTKHDNISDTNAKFYSTLLVRNTAGHTTE